MFVDMLLWYKVKMVVVSLHVDGVLLSGVFRPFSVELVDFWIHWYILWLVRNLSDVCYV